MGVFFLFLFVTFYGSTMDATSYVYCSELFPTPLRAQGTGFSVAGLFTATLIYTQVAPIAFAQVGWRFYILFIILPTIGAIAMWRLFPETKLLSLEEIAALFGDDVAVEINHPSAEEHAELRQRLATKVPEGERVMEAQMEGEKSGIVTQQIGTKHMESD